MINDDLKKLQKEIEKLQVKADALDEIGNLINRYIIHKKDSIEIEPIRKIIYEAFNRTREPILRCKFN